jgi:HEAT repeat protein
VVTAKPTVADYKAILETGSDDDKTKALAALGTLGTPEAVVVIAAVAGGPDARLRTIAAWELGRARAVDRSDQLAALLKDPEASVRAAAAAALGLLHAHPPREAAAPAKPSFVPDLAALLKDPEALVRGRAIQALLQIDAREYIKDVEGLLTDTGKTSVPDSQSREWIALEVREVASRALEVWNATGEDKK